MGEKLLKYFDYVGKQAGGMAARMRLAQLTGLPSPQAQLEPDSDDRIARFEEAVRRITGREPPEI